MSWETVYFNGFEDGQFIAPIPKKMPARHSVVWDESLPRPEMDIKQSPEPEVYEGKYSAVGFHVYTAFKWWCYTDPIPITPGKLTQASALLMVVAHGLGGDNSKPGACGMRVGLSRGDVTNPADTSIAWSEWWVVRDTLVNERGWALKVTPEVTPQSTTVRLWVQCNADVAVTISAGHWDNERVEQYLDGGTPPTPGAEVDYDRIRQIVRAELDATRLTG